MHQNIYEANLLQPIYFVLFERVWKIVGQWSGWLKVTDMKMTTNVQGITIHRVSIKKTSKIIFVITTSNFHHIWQFLAQRWQTVF